MCSFVLFLGGTKKDGRAERRENSACFLPSFSSFFLSVAFLFRSVNFSLLPEGKLEPNSPPLRREERNERGKKKKDVSLPALILLFFAPRFSKSHQPALRKEREGHHSREGDSTKVSHDARRKNPMRQEAEKGKREVL